MAGALRVVLVGDRGSEEGHDAIAGELVDRTLEAIHPLAHQREHAFHDAAPCLSIHALPELHRALDVGE
jgi:hypothetical protein